MTLLTLFTAPKPFTNPHIDLIQRNAIKNWLALGPEVAVLIMGRESGMPEAASESGVRHVHEVACAEAGPPLINSMLDYARRLTDSPYLCISNADILFLPDILEATQKAAKLADKFLLLSQRWDLDVTQALEFSPGWEQRLWADVQTRGKLHPPLGSDYFIFPRSLLEDIPEFIIGRSGWDNWIIYHAIQSGWAVLDVTPSLRMIHQNHDYSHLPGNEPPYKLPETRRNIELAGGEENMLTIMDIPQQLIHGKIRRAPLTTARLVRKLEVALTPKDAHKKGLRWTLTRRVRRLRRRITEGTNQ
jgi:hypothetical protein